MYISSFLYTDVQDLVKVNSHKSGIAFLCVTTYPGTDDFIENCTAMMKMQDCFCEKLGYLTISVGMNVNTFQLDSLVSQIENVSLPESYCRVLFYFFGHGNEESVKLADEYVERQYIISKLQVLSPPDSNIYTIFVFDSCRKVDEPTCVALQESSYFKALAGEAWKSKGQYPDSSNTLVINATNFNCKAYYRVTDGCGPDDLPSD